MRNILLVSLIVVGVGYMFVILSNKYDSIKAISEKNNQQTQQTQQKTK